MYNFSGMNYWVGRFLVALVGLCFVLPGCSNVGVIHQPDIKLESVKVTQTSPEGSRVECTVILENPNEVPLPLVYASYQIMVDGLSFELADKTNRTLPAKGSQTVVLPAAFASTSDLHAKAFTFNTTVRYQPPGQFRKLLTESGIPLPSTSLSSQGQLQ